MKKAAIFFALLLCSLHNFSQSMIDSAITIPMVAISYAYQVPGGGMGERYGDNSSIGGMFAVKLKSNAFIGLKAHYIWGGTVKEEDIFRNIRTSEGGIIEVGGELTDPIIDESGYDFFIHGGYLFHLFGPNPNSGIIISAGPGFLQHQIDIDYRDASIPQLSEEYRRGYDRLSNGFALNEFIGYMNFSKSRLINFYIGIDLIQAWTINRRGYNFDQMAVDNQKRYDTLKGLRFGWILTLHRRAPDNFYYH